MGEDERKAVSSACESCSDTEAETTEVITSSVLDVTYDGGRIGTVEKTLTLSKCAR